MLLRSQGRCSLGAPQGRTSSGARVGAPQEQEPGAAPVRSGHLPPPHVGAFGSSLGDAAAWLQEGDEACSGADCVFEDADVAGREVVEGEAHVFPHSLQKCNGSSDSTQIIHQGDQNFNDSQMYISAVNFPLFFMFSGRRQMSPVSARRVAFVFRDFPIGFFTLFRMISRCVIMCDECALRFYVCSIFVDRVFVLFIFHHGVQRTYKCFAYVAPRGWIWV